MLWKPENRGQSHHPSASSKRIVAGFARSRLHNGKFGHYATSTAGQASSGTLFRKLNCLIAVAQYSGTGPKSCFRNRTQIVAKDASNRGRGQCQNSGRKHPDPRQLRRSLCHGSLGHPSAQARAEMDCVFQTDLAETTQSKTPRVR